MARNLSSVVFYVDRKKEYTEISQETTKMKNWHHNTE